jgi:hypothetical protein
MEQSRIETSTIKREDMINNNNSHHNTSTINQEHSIHVEMPAGVSAKNSARTGYHFYKNSSMQNSA